MSQTTILFLQGAGAGAYAEDKKLVDYLVRELGQEYQIRYPKTPDEEMAGFAEWKEVFESELDNISGKIILVAHSAGGSNLFKYLVENRVKQDVAGVFFIATPYFWGEDKDWVFEGYSVPSDFASTFPIIPTFFYHCDNDEIIPFSHLGFYQDKIPHATSRKIVGRGHQLNNDLHEVVEDIRPL